MIERETLQYMVGGLLYSPAIHEHLADKIANREIPCLTSMALCLEDSILDEALEAAEQSLVRTLRAISDRKLTENGQPLIFIRIRTPEHMRHVHSLIAPYADAIAGYILPKFDLSNSAAYRQLICQINQGRKKPLYVMPILESRMIANIGQRSTMLLEIKRELDEIRQYVLNVRVGGNDFSNLYGLRRAVHQNIYQIGVVRDILIDILNVFSADYVVSGPVWEYFGKAGDEPWARGLKAELELDRLNGFLGKTSIHPSQLPLIYDSLRVSRSDYEDALAILGWNPNALAVSKSADGSRMNEVKCHTKWAKRIATLGQIYGVKDE